MGEKAYGTSAGKASIGYTFRTWENERFDGMKVKIIQKVEDVAKKHKLEFSSKWLETFNANNNHTTAYKEIITAAKTHKIELLDLEKPFEFGEDFGLFTKKYKGAMFGIGSGINQPPLHSSTFDFPDELLEIGSSMFYQIAVQITEK